MKPTMLFAIIALTAIVIASSFGLQLMPVTPAVLPENMSGNVLYVCPTASPTWDAFANAFHPFVKYVIIVFFFSVMILMFVWGWALYQNLLKDKFDRKSFSNIWKITKFAFWAAIVVTIAAATPNHFRTVHVHGADGAWVLCDATTPGGRAVRSDAVH